MSSQHDAPDDPAPTPQPAADRIYHRISEADEALTAGGVEVRGVRTLLLLWKKLGLRGLISVLLVVGFPLGEYSALSYAVNHVLPETVGGLGVQFDAEEWSLHPLTLTAVARHVSLRAAHDAAAAPVLTAAEVVFTGSVWTLIKGLPDMLSFHLFGGQQPFNEVAIKKGELHLERSLTGELNWTDFVDAVPEARFDDAMKGLYQVHAISLEDFRISYVEHLPGNSGGGVIQTAQATVNVDQVSGTITELAQPATIDQRPTRFKFHGRSADGVMEISGQGAFVTPLDAPTSPQGAPSLRSVSSASSAHATRRAPYYRMVVYLENIGAAAYAHMVPVTTIVPVAGTVGGTLTLIRDRSEDVCDGYLTMKDVRFAPNPRVVPRNRQFDVLQLGLERVSASGPLDVCRSPDPGTVPASRPEPPASRLLARLNTQGTVNAPPAVRAITARDERVLTGLPENVTLADLTTGLARQIGAKVGQRFGGVAGQAVEQSLAGRSTVSQSAAPGSRAAESDNPLTKGVKGVGRGFKKLFSGGKKK